MRITRFGIVGGGVAATLLAHFLDERDLFIVDEGTGRGGSSAPTAIFHPFPGRSIRSTQELEEALKVAVPLYEEWANKWPQWVQRRTMLRPLLGKAGERLRKSMGPRKETRVAGVSIRRYDMEEALSRFPELQHDGEVIGYDSCFSVDLGSLMLQVAGDQEKAGLRHRVEVQRIHRDEDSWLLEGEGWERRCRVLILAAGSRLQEWTPGLLGDVEGGHLLALQTDETEWMASRGDIHWCPTSKGAVVGATRWKSDEGPMSADDAIMALSSRAQTLVNFDVGIGSLWEGERLVSAGERLPYAGTIPGTQNGYVLGGLGSKGLLYGPWSASSLAENLLQSKRIPSALTPQFAVEHNGVFLNSSLGS